MKETPQLQNTSDLLEMYEELTSLVGQLNEDAPKIKKMYTSIAETVMKQEAAVAKSEQKIDAAVTASIAQIQKEARAAITASEKHLAAAEAIAKRCESAMSQMEAMVKKITSAQDAQQQFERRLKLIEAQLHTGTMPPVNTSSCASTPRITPPTKGSETSNATSISDYFRGQGFKVIDRRSSGGALWVVGTEAELKSHVTYVKKYFGVTDSCGYSTGRATGGKPGWWTKDTK